MITIELDHYGFTEYVRDKLEPAVVRALNKTAYQSIDSLRDAAKETFTVRRPWILKGFRYSKATKHDPFVEIFHRDSYLNKQVAGGRISPDNGHDKIPVPIGVRQNIKQVVPRKKRRKYLLEAVGVHETDNAIWARKTGRKKSMLMYLLVDEANYKPIFDFEDAVEKSFAARFEQTFARTVSEL